MTGDARVQLLALMDTDPFAHDAEELLPLRLAAERGVAGGGFHPDSLMSAGGGRKSGDLPDHYVEQITGFYGDIHAPGSYGMTEMAVANQWCEAGRYHSVPWVVPLLLDEPDERLLAGDGVVEGRFGFLDLAWAGRWGGVITSDEVRVDFAPVCGCGRPGPVILADISRFSADDDKIGCAGTMDQYVRGLVGS